MFPAMRAGVSGSLQARAQGRRVRTALFRNSRTGAESAVHPSNSSESSAALLSIARVERAIEAHYAIVALSRDLRLQTEQSILEQIASQRENEIAVRQRLPMRQRKLLDERSKLLEAHYAGAIPLDLLKTEQDRIGGAWIDERCG